MSVLVYRVEENDNEPEVRWPDPTGHGVGCRLEARRPSRSTTKESDTMMGYGWAGWGDGFWMFVGLLLMIGFVLLIVWAISIVSRAGNAPTHDPSRSRPSEILRERFARGEITEQEFEQAKKVLGPDR
jgi:putative membrane protein